MYYTGVQLVRYFSPRDLICKCFYWSWNGALIQHLKKNSPFCWQFSQVFDLYSTSLRISAVSPYTHLGFARNFIHRNLRHRATTFVPMTLAYSLVFTFKTLLQFKIEKSRFLKGVPIWWIGDFTNFSEMYYTGVQLVPKIFPRRYHGKCIYWSWKGALILHSKKNYPFCWKFSQVFALYSYISQYFDSITL